MITTREQQIIDLHEQGYQALQIAKMMKLTVEYVRRRISTLCHGTGPDDTYRRAMEAGSRALRDAIMKERFSAEEKRTGC